VLVEIEGRDVRAAPIDRVKQMILGAPGSMLRLLVLRNSMQGQSPVAISLQRSKPVATTNAMPPPPPPTFLSDANLTSSAPLALALAASVTST
jgi:hypothetical protein